jgi:hypothetical protein
MTLLVSADALCGSRRGSIVARLNALGTRSRLIGPGRLSLRDPGALIRAQARWSHSGGAASSNGSNDPRGNLSRRVC